MKDFPSSHIHKWKRFGPGFWCITIFFNLFDVCLCNVLVLCSFFFHASVSLSWSTESVDSVGTTIFTLPKVISSFIFYRYQFDVCLCSNVCQEYVFLVFFFFSTFICFLF